MARRPSDHNTGYSRAQVTRLVTQWHANRFAVATLAKHYRAPAAPFARKYTACDVVLVVEMGKANEEVCRPAIAHLLQRAYRDYGDGHYERLPCFTAAFRSACAAIRRRSPKGKRWPRLPCFPFLQAGSILSSVETPEV